MDEDEQLVFFKRYSPFRTRCTINGKIYYVIIDSRSSENIVSKKLIDALKLKTAPPLKVSWIKRGESINEICTMPFP